jgi:cytochrome c5
MRGEELAVLLYSRSVMTINRLLVILPACAIASVFLHHAPPARAAQAQSTLDGVFSAAQAERGKEAYSTTCEACHKADLSGFADGMASALSGSDFFKTWSGKTLGDLFEKMQTMPPGEETKITDAARADVLAHLLNANHFPPGEKELAHEVAPLKEITIAAPKQ